MREEGIVSLFLHFDRLSREGERTFVAFLVSLFCLQLSWFFPSFCSDSEDPKLAGMDGGKEQKLLLGTKQSAFFFVLCGFHSIFHSSAVQILFCDFPHCLFCVEEWFKRAVASPQNVSLFIFACAKLP